MSELRLEALSEAHLPALQAMLADPLVQRFTPVPDRPPPDQAETMLRVYAADDTREAFAAVDDAGLFHGLGVVIGISWSAAECELGYMVAPACRGRGSATRMLQLLTSRALEEHRMQRVQLRINVGNVASERVAQRNGYTREGLLRSTYLKPGVRVDTTLWSRLPGDVSLDGGALP